MPRLFRSIRFRIFRTAMLIACAPLAANAVQQTVLIRFFGGELTVFVPDADNAMPATVAQRHYFTKLAISMKGFLDFNFQADDRRFALQ